MRWILGLPFALIVLGPGMILVLEYSIGRLCSLGELLLRSEAGVTSITLAIGAVTALIFVAIAMRCGFKKKRGPLLAAMMLAAATGSIVFTGVFVYELHQIHARNDRLAIGGPDQAMLKPDTQVSEVTIEMHEMYRPGLTVLCTNSEAIRGLLVALQETQEVQEHHCAHEGTICFRKGSNTLMEIMFLAGHNPPYYEYRHGTHIYRLPKESFLSALAGLGLDTRILETETDRQ